MKDAFENNLKQSLENFEMPYDTNAWTAMQSRLDATADTPSFEEKMKEGLNANEYAYNPAAWSEMSKRLDKGTKGGAKKWYYAAAVIGAAAVTTALLWNTNSNNEAAAKQNPTSENGKNVVSEAQNANNTSTKTSSASSPNAKGNSVASNAIQDQSSSNGAANANDVINQSSSGNQGSNTTNSQQETLSNTFELIQNHGGNSNSSLAGPTDVTSNNSSTTTAWRFIAPALPQALCEGSTIQIKNDNAYPLVIMYPNGLNWMGNENQVTSLNPSIAGVYKMGYFRNNKFREKGTFTVHEKPTADIDFVDLSQKYLNGLPTVEVRSTSPATNYHWEYENGVIEGATAGLHFYDAGLHLVKLTVTNENGCSASIEKPVNVTEDYNLMAVNAFYPTGSDRSTNTFMPYALTERNVNFKLIIVDPNDGHTLYETSDATEGWNGIDQLTGSLVPLEKSYIWKVTILNPAHGEDNVYAGTILTLPQ